MILDWGDFGWGDCGGVIMSGVILFGVILSAHPECPTYVEYTVGRLALIRYTIGTFTFKNRCTIQNTVNVSMGPRSRIESR